MRNILRRAILLTLKLLALAAVAALAIIQIPEMRYDLGPKTPKAIESPEELAEAGITRATFVRLAGEGDFDAAHVYERYGLAYTYFLLKPYGRSVVVRSYEPVTEDWRTIRQFVGKLKSFDKQPFSYRVRENFRQQHGVEIPDDAYFLALYDVPKPDGWQIGALIFCGLLAVAMTYLFFFFRRRKPAGQDQPSGSEEQARKAD